MISIEWIKVESSGTIWDKSDKLYVMFDVKFHLKSTHIFLPISFRISFRAVWNEIQRLDQQLESYCFTKSCLKFTPLSFWLLIKLSNQKVRWFLVLWLKCKLKCYNWCSLMNMAVSVFLKNVLIFCYHTITLDLCIFVYLASHTDTQNLFLLLKVYYIWLQ